MAADNKVIDPNLAQKLFRKSDLLKRKRSGQPAAIESFPRVVKKITSLWRYAEGSQYLEQLNLPDTGKQRTGFPPEAQDELKFLYELLRDQREILFLRG